MTGCSHGINKSNSASHLMQSLIEIHCRPECKGLNLNLLGEHIGKPRCNLKVI